MKSPAFLATLLATCGVAGSVFGAAATFNTVGALDPNNGTSNSGVAMTVSDAASNTLANGLTFANFSSLVSTAFTNDTGGVVNFEAANLTTGNAANATIGDSAANAITAKYGASLANSESFYRSDAGATATQALDYNTNQGGYLASGVAGGGYLGVQGPSSYSITFLQPIADFGITLLPRADGGKRTSQFVIHYSDSSTTTSSTETTNPAGQSTNAVFFGFSAPAGLTISSVDSTNAAGASRFDDLAFITPASVSPVPEPASLGVLALGGVGLLAGRRRRA